MELATNRGLPPDCWNRRTEETDILDLELDVSRIEMAGPLDQRMHILAFEIKVAFEYISLNPTSPQR